MASFPNIYTHRKVAETAAKSCEICFKPSTSVLLASGHKDFFYVCQVHLKDKKFCKPLTVQINTATQKKWEIGDEIARLKKEYEVKQSMKNNKGEDAPKLKEKVDLEIIDDKSSNKKKDSNPITVESNEPKEFSLTNIFYQQRIEKKKNAEIAKQRSERFQNPNLFPKVPKNLP
ncbi:putative fungal protein [Erysiphe necator]|uniref:Putative fungal protein n=1 Tax=Uncinula necator TaxID=52586 RepID=A0A0B1P5M7_UNCNE|nr:putative fungal protein [Erysiphe necator]